MSWKFFHSSHRAEWLLGNFGGDGDVTLADTTDLAGFSVTLNDIDPDFAIDNELAGEIIRFATAVQAEREINVVGADDDAGGVWNPATDADQYFERDTSVIWLFDAIEGTATPGKIDTSDYDIALGRVWVNDVLVDGQNIEDIFSSPSQIQANPDTGVINLNSSTIVRVVNTADLATLLPENLDVSRTVEVEAFTQLPDGLIFNNEDLLVGVENLTLDLGGQVNIGDVSIDDIVNDNEFGTLTSRRSTWLRSATPVP